jgi:membrane protein implicated in regulation of membrane protease activity
MDNAIWFFLGFVAASVALALLFRRAVKRLGSTIGKLYRSYIDNK